MARCKFCGQEIDWITSLEGKQVPVDPDPVFVIEDDGPDTFLDDMGDAITGRQAKPEEERRDLTVAFVPHRRTCPWADKPAQRRVENGNTIKRDGAASMLYWLDSKTDFFTAPASTNKHLAQPGGLVIHSLNVYKRLLEITARDVFGGTDGALLAEDVVETVAILGLLHDVCKAGVYHQETKRRKNPDTGKWEDYLGYTFRDPFPLGHGEKSLYLITRHMALTEEEALAIRWHMGAYDDAVKGGSRSMTEAMNLTPWVWRLQEADMCAAWIDERSAAE